MRVAVSDWSRSTDRFVPLDFDSDEELAEFFDPFRSRTMDVIRAASSLLPQAVCLKHFYLRPQLAPVGELWGHDTRVAAAARAGCE